MHKGFSKNQHLKKKDSWGEAEIQGAIKECGVPYSLQTWLRQFALSPFF
jgi:hypothetical protein